MRPLTRELMESRYLKGFGQGSGSVYQPWLDVHDVPSNGVTRRTNGRKTGRQHVTFSLLEEGALLCAQRLNQVVDIREQYPLYPLEDTVELAKRLSINHPTHPKDGSLVMMTTDLLLTEAAVDGQQRFSAIAVKPSLELSNTKTLGKLEIERLYWETRETAWSLVTERELPEALISNLRWIDDFHEISPETLSSRQIERAERLLLQKFVQESGQPLNELCLDVDDQLGLSPGRALGVVRHCLSTKRWKVNLRVKVDPMMPFPVPLVAERGVLIAA
jgi:hypothetical protein